MKSRGGKSQRREEKKKKHQKRESLRRKKIQVREKVRKSRNTVFMICGSGGSKSRLAKAVGAEPPGQMRDEQVHAVVARSTCQNVRNTTGSDHFWKLRCRKSARRCGAKHISKRRTTFGSSDLGKSARRCGAKHILKSKCTKHTMSGTLLEVEMLKKCTPLSREAHFQVKMCKTHHVRTTFGGSDVENARRCGAKHISKSTCAKHTMFGPLLEVEMSKKCTPLWREAHCTFRSQNVKNIMFGPLLDVQMSFRVAGARDCAPCQK